MSDLGDITLLLRQADEGDHDAADALFRLVEEELKAIVKRRKAMSRPGDDQATTALVDDAFLGLVGQNVTVWQSGDRRKFYGYISRQVHDRLIDAARAQLAQKRGGGRRPARLEDAGVLEDKQEGLASSTFLLDLKDALERFQEFAPEEAECFRIRYFLGSTVQEVAELLDLTAPQVKHRINMARMWLKKELGDYDLET